jgi:DNA-binding MarR family transcriptional regulator
MKSGFLLEKVAMSRVIKSPGESPPNPDKSNKSFIARWKHEGVFDKGFVAVPVRFLELFARMKPHSLTLGEALFVLQLMSFKWSEDAPFPSYKRIAERMDITDKMVRRYAQSLEVKGYLRRQVRKNNTNMFDLSGLFDALLAAVKRDQRTREELSLASEFETALAEFVVKPSLVKSTKILL